MARTLAAMPAFVDAIVVVDDASRDATSAAALAVGDPRVRVVRHAVNRGVGAAIATGYREALALGADVLAVMAGDAQMHPDDLPALLAPVLLGAADYAKGDRLGHPARREMPLLRRVVGRALSWLTARATGFSSLSDSQCGYTALSARAASRLDLDALWPRYGYPNDLLGQLARARCRVVDVPVRPVYRDERSGLRAWHVATILWLIARAAWQGRALSRAADDAPQLAPSVGRAGPSRAA